MSHKIKQLALTNMQRKLNHSFPGCLSLLKPVDFSTPVEISTIPHDQLILNFLNLL